MRTNIVLDDNLMSSAIRSSGFKTKKRAIEEGLKLLIQVNKGNFITFPVYTGDVAASILAALERGVPGAGARLSRAVGLCRHLPPPARRTR